MCTGEMEHDWILPTKNHEHRKQRNTLMRMRVRVMFTLLYNKWLCILNCDNNHVCVIVDETYQKTRATERMNNYVIKIEKYK